MPGWEKEIRHHEFCPSCSLLKVNLFWNRPEWTGMTMFTSFVFKRMSSSLSVFPSMRRWRLLLRWRRIKQLLLPSVVTSFGDPESGSVRTDPIQSPWMLVKGALQPAVNRSRNRSMRSGLFFFWKRIMLLVWNTQGNSLSSQPGRLRVVWPGMPTLDRRSKSTCWNTFEYERLWAVECW